MSGSRTAPRLAFVVGDDRTDEDAFSSLADAITIHVGPGDSTAAGYYLPDQSDLGSLLSRVLELWKNRRAPPIPPHSPTSAGRLWH